MPEETVPPVWYEVLCVYCRKGGTGLSGRALVTLTGIPWRTLRKSMLDWNAIHNDILVYRCKNIGADLFTRALYSGRNLELDMPSVDHYMRKYKESEGINDGEGEQTLTVHGGQAMLDLLNSTVAKYHEQAKAKSAK